jgi:hypothetical protein
MFVLRGIVLIAPIDASVCHACCFGCLGETKNDPQLGRNTYRTYSTVARQQSLEFEACSGWRCSRPPTVTCQTTPCLQSHRETDSQSLARRTQHNTEFSLSRRSRDTRSFLFSIDTHTLRHASCGGLMQEKTRQHAVVGPGNRATTSTAKIYMNNTKKRYMPIPSHFGDHHGLIRFHLNLAGAPL